MASILDNQPIDEVFDVALSLGALFVARDGDEPVGLALVREGTVEAVYVIESHRRRGVARALLNAVMGARREVLDAYALPGDRATKSLYESFGWKARLLTMRAE
jgi:GNAT superfamily N-acetyltransferase